MPDEPLQNQKQQMSTKNYKLGINAMGGSDHIEMIGRVGFDGFFTGWDHDKIGEWADLAAKRGLIYQSIHSPFTKVHHIWHGGEAGIEATQELIRCVEDCAKFDIPVMVIHPFIGFREHTPTEIGLDNYSRIVEVANKLGIKLGFENVEGEEYLAALMDKFWDEECCGFCLDTGHEQCYNGGKDMMALYGQKLCHTHFNDNLGIIFPDAPIDSTWRNDLHLVMGDGIVDWKNVMDRIDASPYEGILICELTRSNKPGRHDHDGYAAMDIEAFYAFALHRAKMVIDRKL
jgi:sugar phosphate isomerase/epimerase